MVWAESGFITVIPSPTSCCQIFWFETKLFRYKAALFEVEEPEIIDVTVVVILFTSPVEIAINEDNIIAPSCAKYCEKIDETNCL